AAYNLVFSSKLTPLVDIESMEAAFRALFERHPMLSATFHQVNGEPIQRIHSGKTIDFREHDVSGINEKQIKDLIEKHAELPFDLENGPVIRLELFRNGDGSHIVLLAMHHIISDAWSVSLLMNDLIESYFSIKSEKIPDLEPIEYSYQDYVNWQQHNLLGPYKKRASEYWLSSLEGASGSLDLPTDHSRPAVQTFNGGRLSFILDDNLASRVIELAQRQSATLYTTMLSAYNALFHRYCDQDDIVVGSPMAGRNQKELGDILGYFVNMVPLRSSTHDDPSFIEFLDRTLASVNGAIENQNYPFSRIINDLKMTRDPTRSPLFQISFAMERVPGVDEQGIAVFLIGKGGHQFSVGDMTVETIDLNLRQAQFEITLVVEESGGQIFGCWQYNRDLFKSETIQKLSETFSLLLENVTRNPDIKISEIELLSEDESELITSSWNLTGADYPQDKGIHHLVEEQASKTPDAVAIHFGEQKITYEELERLANNVAGTLIDRGIGPNDSVALMVERNTLMITAMLGILKSGAHYVPIDPDYPCNRIQKMLKNSGSSLLVVSEGTHHLVPSNFTGVFRVEECAEMIGLPDRLLFDADNLAYVIYTSGSTGEPKGVEISHSSAVNFLTSMRQTPGITRLDRLLALTTLSFDISILEIFLPLITGAQVVIATKEDARDGRRISRLLNDHSVTIMQATPTTWRILMESGWEGRNGLKILCGGEAMPRDLADFLVNSADEVWNLYGPTETTVWSTCIKVLPGEEKLSIGKPISNTKIYILDDNNNIQPISFVGEICIGGAGLARGYRRKEELTDESFIEVEIPNQGTQRLYRTGDLGRWLSDGTLECLGRIDFQTKLRGFRIELGEIEFAIMNHEAVSSAVVIKRDDLPGGEALVAYFVIESELSNELLVSIKEHLCDRLPKVMVPTYFVNLEALPLTPNQKIDRRALPAPESGSIGLDHNYIPPKTITETKLAQIFSNAFENPMVSIKDNFFDMGGDSLMAVKIVSRVSNALEKDIPLEAFFRFPTIEKFARFVDAPVSMDNVSEPLLSEEEIDTEYLSFQITDHDKLDSLPNINAVALSYIPESFTEVTGLSKKELINNWFGNKARLTNLYRTQWGAIGLIMLPVFETDLYNDSNPISSIIMDGLRLSAKLGARKASLTGVLPLVTNDGLDVINWMRENDEEVNLPIITTGNATRCATIIKSVEGILARSGRDISKLRVSFIGLGSIGKGTLDLMLDVLPHPRGIIMSDLYRQEDRLEELQDRLLASGFVGEIDICSSRGELPDKVYESGLIIAASNVPNIIDVEKVRPGTMIVDYSFPSSFNLIDAARRTEQEGDLIFTSGGQLRLRQEIEEII
ncbi:MAG: amino acid adenylation domain-containing protein, partial [Verrucomicrobiota bacterium]|nr:amino acid adenylation domain-containing protein [Verrucomicrobiota bacterium]